ILRRSSRDALSITNSVFPSVRKPTPYTHHLTRSQCSLRSVSQSQFGAPTVNNRVTRSSNTGRPSCSCLAWCTASSRPRQPEKPTPTHSGTSFADLGSGRGWLAADTGASHHQHARPTARSYGEPATRQRQRPGYVSTGNTVEKQASEPDTTQRQEPRSRE